MTFSPVPARGHRIRSTRVDGITITYSSHHQDVPWHVHEHTMVVLGVAGAFSESYTGRIPSAACSIGTALVRPAGELHSNRFASGGARDVAIELEEAALNRLHVSPAALDAVSACCDRHIAVLTRRMIGELATRDTASPLALEALALELFAFMVRSADRSNASDRGAIWLQHVRAFVREEWQRRPISLNDLARIAGVHPVHLVRVYRSHFGETPAESIRRLRVEWAARELLASSRPISAIAVDAGFTDQSHLTRAFRASFGTTPRAWRRSSRVSALGARDR